MEILIQGKSSEEIYKDLELEEHSVYEVVVKNSENNVPHQAFLHTGFKTGGYNMIYQNSYDNAVKLQEMYSVKKVKFLTKIKLHFQF